MTDRSEAHRNPELVGVKAGGNDDAVHLVDRKAARYTLCGMRADTRNIEVLTADLKVEVHAACWSCVHNAQAVLRRKAAA
jgi:hypothetical protein